MGKISDALRELSAEKAGLEERVREFEEQTGICVEEAVFRRKYLPNERGIKDFKEDCFVNVELDLKI